MKRCLTLHAVFTGNFPLTLDTNTKSWSKTRYQQSACPLVSLPLKMNNPVIGNVTQEMYASTASHQNPLSCAVSTRAEFVAGRILSKHLSFSNTKGFQMPFLSSIVSDHLFEDSEVPHVVFLSFAVSPLSLYPLLFCTKDKKQTKVTIMLIPNHF